MTDVDLLRRAAALMRERAQAANSDGWDDWQYGIWPKVDAAHIVSWHPAAALAVADWLDQYADAISDIGTPARDDWDAFPAFKVAAAYLGHTP